MKNNLRLTFILAALALIFGCAANDYAQKIDVPVVGGYSNAAVTDPQIVSAANFAVKAHAKKDKTKIRLVAVNRAAQQVVAGMNYKLCLNVEVSDRKKKTAATPQIVEAIVYKNLKGKLALASWAIAACTDAAPMVAPIDKL